jgi:hypothetical protein
MPKKLIKITAAIVILVYPSVSFATILPPWYNCDYQRVGKTHIYCATVCVNTRTGNFVHIKKTCRG